MKLKKMEIRNYRNLDGVAIHFNLESNYIVGENNIGKSNLLELIMAVSNGGSFADYDFDDADIPIEIDLCIRLDESERFSFEPYAWPDEKGGINIRILKESKDIPSRMIDLSSHRQIPAEQFQKMNFMKFETNINPNLELSMIDENQPMIGQSGSSAPFAVIAVLNIFNKILELYHDGAVPFENLAVTSKEGKRILPLILAIDEPEVHLHPYMQRAILNYYKRILKNDDPNFLEILKYSFDLDGLDGQLIIVTHSTDALIDDHRNIVRFYRTSSGTTDAICGMDLNIRTDVEKHLLMHFPDLKEAFYSRCVLIAEGETEYGCIRGFAGTIGISLDDYGICFVNAQGESSIPKLQKLFRHFSIPTVVIYDADVKEGKTPGENDFFTKGVCFEMDVADKLVENKRIDLMHQIALELSGNATRQTLELDYLRKPLKKINYNLDQYQPKSLDELDLQDPEEYRSIYYAWLYKRKGIVIGRIIGNLLPAECIPDCYIQAINRAKEVSMQ